SLSICKGAYANHRGKDRFIKNILPEKEQAARPFLFIQNKAVSPQNKSGGNGENAAFLQNALIIKENREKPRRKIKTNAAFACAIGRFSGV
ncbi:MAG: hypothetical protein ACLUO4_08835, partial [Christensenellales bacterium]